MRPDMHVVADLDLVVEAHVFLEHGVFQCTAIDAGVGADFAIVADGHAAQLRHLDPVAGVHRQAEAIGADHRARMHAYASPQPGPRHQRHPRNEFAAVADVAVLADHAAGTDHAGFADAAARADAHERPDAGGRSDDRVGVDDCAGMHARGSRSDRFEQRCDPGEGGVRVFGDQRRMRGRVGVGFPQHHHRGVAGLQLAAVARVGQERELAFAGAGQRGHAAHGSVAIAMHGQAEAFG
jgi:hypothetical protein